jgi:hypothetical protein
MTTRLRDWVILAVALAAVFAVSVHAPRAGREQVHSAFTRPTGTPAAGPYELRPRRPRAPQRPEPFHLVDPKPMLLYVR